VAALLIEHIAQEPAHQVEPRLWIGDRRAAYPSFATAVGFTAILSLHDHGAIDSKTRWLETDVGARHVQAVFEVRACGGGEWPTRGA
jgi:hypothetical protein